MKNVEDPYRNRNNICSGRQMRFDDQRPPIDTRLSKTYMLKISNFTSLAQKPDLKQNHCTKCCPIRCPWRRLPTDAESLRGICGAYTKRETRRTDTKRSQEPAHGFPLFTRFVVELVRARSWTLRSRFQDDRWTNRLTSRRLC